MILRMVAPALRIVIAAAVIKARLDDQKLREPRAKGHEDADGNESNTKKAP